MNTSCPDWRNLCAQREAAADEAPGRRVADDAPGRRAADDAPWRRVTDDAPWRSALRHLDQCPACQADAPAFDPTLMFRSLPVLEVDRDGIEAMKQAVAGMRRGQKIEDTRGSHRRGSRMRPWLRAAALAAVLLGSLVLRGSGVVVPDDIAPTASMVPTSGVSETVPSDVDLWRMPLIETADPTYGSIIQVVDDDISLILVVSSEVDV